MDNKSDVPKKLKNLNCLKGVCDKKQCCKELHHSCLCESDLEDYTDPYSDFKRKKNFDCWPYKDVFDSQTYDEKDFDYWLDKF